jgi:hypothetical protein
MFSRGFIGQGGTVGTILIGANGKRHVLWLEGTVCGVNTERPQGSRGGKPHVYTTAFRCSRSLIPQGRRKAPTPIPALPTPTDGSHPCLTMIKAIGQREYTVGVGGMVDVGRGPCADPGSHANPKLSGVDPFDRPQTAPTPFSER